MKANPSLPVSDLSPRRMVPSIILACLLFALSASSGLCSDDRGKKADSKADKAKISAKMAKLPAAGAGAQANTSTNKAVVTGTRIPRKIEAHGRANATSSAVYIVDRQEIERSGAMTTAALLRRLPFAR